MSAPARTLTAGETVSGLTLRQTFAAYLALTKPRIIELLLVTTLPTMFLAQRGLPSLALILSTLVGGTLSAAAANTLNCYLDRDIDTRMSRTKSRNFVNAGTMPRAIASRAAAWRRVRSASGMDAGIFSNGA